MMHFIYKSRLTALRRWNIILSEIVAILAPKTVYKTLAWIVVV